MKYLIIIVWLLLVMVALLTSGYLCYKGINGWGWFLFAGIILAAGFTYSEKDGEEQETK